MFRTIKKIINWSEEYKERLYLGVVFSFFESVMTSAPIMVTAWALGKVLESYWGKMPLPENIIPLSTIAMIALILLRFLFSYGKAVLQESIGYEVAARQRIRLGDVLKRVPLGYFAKNSVGDILAGVTSELSALELQSMKMVDAVLNGYIQLLAVIVCLAFFSPAIIVIAVIGALISAAALKGISIHSEKTAPKTNLATEEMSGAAIEYIRGLPIVKSFGKEGVSIDNFRNACKKLKDIHIEIEKGFVPYNCIHLLALKLASMGVVLFCAWQSYNSQMETSVFLMFVLFSFVIFRSVENINDAAHVLGVVDAVIERLNELERADYIDENGKEITPENYDIEFRNVFFGYSGRTVLYDISFSIPQYTTTAIVGASGSGKSTICNLIARFYDVDHGEILLGNHNVREYKCDSLLKNISMVFQNVYLFRDTIKNNIKFGMPNASDEQIVEAAKAARCHDFIMALPKGYETIVGEGGSSLSGGEKQRISIARAILKDAPVIILDEATASIDPENEYFIQEAISALTKGKTIITIAHRLATIENADQILVVDNGAIVQKGTHRQLFEQEGIYKEFIEIREKAEGWRIEA